MWDRVSLLCVMTLRSIMIKRRRRRLRRGYRVRKMVAFGGGSRDGVLACILSILKRNLDFLLYYGDLYLCAVLSH
jgi:hypothetical protein